MTTVWDRAPRQLRSRLGALPGIKLPKQPKRQKTQAQKDKDKAEREVHQNALETGLIQMRIKYLKEQQLLGTEFPSYRWDFAILDAAGAIVLGVVGLMMIYSSVLRIIHPLSIHYNQALFVAVVGLVVNLACAYILNSAGHAHDAGHSAHHAETDEQDHHDHAHDDLNLKAAYLHVMADALTSVLAIVALLGAKYFNVTWLDPFMGIVGAALILRWAYRLLKETGNILLERETDDALINEIRQIIESDGDSRICDVHLWKVAQHKYACILSLVAANKYSADEYKARLNGVHELAHITIEVNACPECSCK